MKNVIGLGNALVDVLIRIKDDEILERFSLPKGSMTLVDRSKAAKMAVETQGLEKSLSPGGSAANTIYGLARMGIPTGYIGSISKDDFGSLFKNGLEDFGTRTFLHYSSTETGRATTFISPDSERTFGTYLGAAVELNASRLKSDYFNGFDCLHFEGYLVPDLELVNTAIRMAKRNQQLVSVDMASYNIVEENLEVFRKLISESVDIVFANEEEAKILTGEEPEKAIHILAGECEIAVVKIGAEGSLIKSGNKMYHVKAVESGVVDTTGAGDLYASGFFYGLTKGYSLDQCGYCGAVMAGKTIEYFGAKMDEDQWPLIKSLLG